jgi:hypothetical protein
MSAANTQSEVRRRDEEIAKLKTKLAQARAEADAVYDGLAYDGYLESEIRTLREFIDDVRLGIRDLSEYRDICG